NEATAEEATRAKAHIVVCPNCASHLAFLRLTGRALSQTPEVIPSASLSSRIAAATYDRPTLAERIAGWLRPAPVRIGLGAAMAAGLALVLIVPRMGEVDTAELPSAPAGGGVVSTRKEVGKSAQKVAGKTPSKSVVKTAKTAEPSRPKPKMTVATKPLEAKPPVAAKSPVVLPAKRPITVVAKVSRPGRLESIQAATVGSLSASDIIRDVRGEPRMDRNSPLRSAANIALKRPGGGVVFIPRSGYDRSAATESSRRARGAAGTVASVTPTLPTAGAAPISPLLSEHSTITESTAPRSPVASSESPSAAVAASAGTAMMQFRVRGPRTSNTVVMNMPNASQGGAGSLPANDRFSLTSGSSSRIPITSAPVSGIN
ncbi:MAG: hypothetical protein V4671_00005, partial [Armatimonadota bacterium]